MALKPVLFVLCVSIVLDVTFSRHLSHLRRTNNANSLSSRLRTSTNSRRGNVIQETTRQTSRGNTLRRDVSTTDRRRDNLQSTSSSSDRRPTRPVPKSDVDRTMNGLGAMGNVLPSPINQFIKDLRQDMPNLSIGIGASFGKRGRLRGRTRQSRRQQTSDRFDNAERIRNTISSLGNDPLLDLRDPFPVGNRNTLPSVDNLDPRFSRSRETPPLPDFTTGFGISNNQMTQPRDPWMQSGNFIDRFAPEPTFLLSGGQQSTPKSNSLSTNRNALNRIAQDRTLNSNSRISSSLPSLPNINNNQASISSNLLNQGQNSLLNQNQMLRNQGQGQVSQGTINSILQQLGNSQGQSLNQLLSLQTQLQNQPAPLLNSQGSVQTLQNQLLQQQNQNNQLMNGLGVGNVPQRVLNSGGQQTQATMIQNMLNQAFNQQPASSNNALLQSLGQQNIGMLQSPSLPMQQQTLGSNSAQTNGNIQVQHNQNQVSTLGQTGQLTTLLQQLLNKLDGKATNPTSQANQLSNEAIQSNTLGSSATNQLPIGLGRQTNPLTNLLNNQPSNSRQIPNNNPLLGLLQKAQQQPGQSIVPQNMLNQLNNQQVQQQQVQNIPTQNIPQQFQNSQQQTLGSIQQQPSGQQNVQQMILQLLQSQNQQQTLQNQPSTLQTQQKTLQAQPQTVQGQQQTLQGQQQTLQGQLQNQLLLNNNPSTHVSTKQLPSITSQNSQNDQANVLLQALLGNSAISGLNTNNIVSNQVKPQQTVQTVQGLQQSQIANTGIQGIQQSQQSVATAGNIVNTVNQAVQTPGNNGNQLNELIGQLGLLLNQNNQGSQQINNQATANNQQTELSTLLNQQIITQLLGNQGNANKNRANVNNQNTTPGTNSPLNLAGLLESNPKLQSLQSLLNSQSAQVTNPTVTQEITVPSTQPAIPPIEPGEIEIAPPISLSTISPMLQGNNTASAFNMPIQRQKQDQQLSLSNNLPLEVSGNSQTAPAQSGVTQETNKQMQEMQTTSPDRMLIKLNRTSKGIRLVPDGTGGVRIINLRAAASTQTPWIESVNSSTMNGVANSGASDGLSSIALKNPTNETLRKLEVTDRLNTTDIPEEIELPNGTSLDGPGPAGGQTYPGQRHTKNRKVVSVVVKTTPNPGEIEETTTPMDMSEMGELDAEEILATMSNMDTTEITTTEVITTPTPKTTTTKLTIPTTTSTTLVPTTAAHAHTTTASAPTTTPQTIVQTALGWLSPLTTTPVDVISAGGLLNINDPHLQTKAHAPALYDILSEVMLGKMKGLK